MNKIFKKAKAKFGFTFIEIITVISIFSVLAGIVLFNFSDFTDNINIQNLIQDVALEFNLAQHSALSGSIPTDPNKQFLSGQAPMYGIYFNQMDPSKFIYFLAPTGNPNFNYTGNPFASCSQNNQCLDVINMNGGNVNSIYIDNGLGESLCTSCEISITFKRPFPDAMIYANGLPVASSARIQISSNNGNFSKSIRIRTTGQISVE